MMIVQLLEVAIIPLGVTLGGLGAVPEDIQSAANAGYACYWDSDEWVCELPDANADYTKKPDVKIVPQYIPDPAAEVIEQPVVQEEIAPPPPPAPEEGEYGWNCYIHGNKDCGDLAIADIGDYPVECRILENGYTMCADGTVNDGDPGTYPTQD